MKKLLCLVFACLLTVSIFAGCGGEKTDKIISTDKVYETLTEKFGTYDPYTETGKKYEIYSQQNWNEKLSYVGVIKTITDPKVEPTVQNFIMLADGTALYTCDFDPVTDEYINISKNLLK